MRVETRLFGTIEIAEDKIITLGRGLIGYPDMKRFTLIFDEEKQDKGRTTVCYAGCGSIGSL